MMKLQLQFRASVLFVSSLFCGVAVADPSPLSMFPPETAVVSKIRKVEETRDKLANLADRVFPSAGQFVRNGPVSLGSMVENPTDAGLDTAEDFYIGVLVDENRKEQTIYVVRHNNLEAMQDALNGEMEMLPADEWIAYSKSKEAIDRVREVYGKSEGTLESRISPKLREMFDELDAVAYVNADELTTRFSEDLKRIQADLHRVLENELLPQFRKHSTDFDWTLLIRIYGKMIDGVFQAMEDAQGLVVGVELRDDGLLFRGRAEVFENSLSAQYLEHLQAGPAPGFEKLPAGGVQYAAVNVPGLVGDFAEIIAKSPPAEFDKQKQGEYEEHVRKTAELMNGEFLSVFAPADDDPGLLQGMMLIGANDPGAFKTRVQGTLLYATSGTPSPTGNTLEFEPNAENAGSVKLDVLQFKIPAAAPEVEQLLKSLLGGNQFEARIMQHDENLLISYSTRATLDRSLKQLREPQGADLANSTVRLPKECSYVYLISYPKMLRQFFLKDDAQLLGPIPVNKERVKNLELTDTYVAAGLRIEPAGMEGAIDVPIEQLSDLLKLFAPR